MTVVEHLAELRRRLIVSAAAFVVISTLAFIYFEPLSEFLTRPYCQLPPRLLPRQGCDLIVLKPLSAFYFRLKLTALAGIALSSPLWLYQIFAFIVPALTHKERRYAIPFLLSSVALFLMGAAFAYLTLPTGLSFLLGLGGSKVDTLLGAEEYLDFIGLLLLGFGITFELPLVLIFLGLAGAVSAQQLRQQRRTAIVLIFLLAAVVTPSQDPYTMSVLAIPLYLLYEVTIVVLSRLVGHREEAPRS